MQQRVHAGEVAGVEPLREGVRRRERGADHVVVVNAIAGRDEDGGG